MSPRRLIVVTASLALLATGFGTRLSSAAFTASKTVGANTVTADKLGNYFSVSGSSPYASGNVDTLSLGLGTVPSARTLTGVFSVTNASSSTQTAKLTLAGVPQVASAVFASSGTATAALAAGASTTVTVTTSATVAGHGSGTLELRLSGSSWLYRTYSVTIDEAPEAPPTLVATAKAAGKVALVWSASTTTTNLGGYDVYRSTGGAYAKLNASPLAGTSYTDSATADGISYSYEVTAVSASLTSLVSPIAAATADASAPAAPTAVSIGGGWVNLASRTNVSLTVTLPPGSVAGDRVDVSIGDGSRTVTGWAGGGSTSVTVSGIDASSLSDGALTLSATATDAAGNVSAARAGTASKDTVAPAAPTGAYADGSSSDSITGTAEAGATVKAQQTAPAGNAATYSTSGGAYTLAVASTSGTNGHPVAVAYNVWAVDAAGNSGAIRSVAASDTR